MLINSSVVKGKCPVCGAANCACGGPSHVVPVDERVTRADDKGEMVRVPIGRGAYIKMRRTAPNKRRA